MHQVEEPSDPKPERVTLSLGDPVEGEALQEGDLAFAPKLRLLNSPAGYEESEALDRLNLLKRHLKKVSGAQFWETLIYGITSLTGAQYGFVSKRLQDVGNLETTEIAQVSVEESCLLAIVLYWNDGGKLKNLTQDYKYWASGSLCGGMRHNKVYLVPEGLAELFPNNPNQLPFPAEAYIGLPLFSGEQCLGHFGLMWNTEGLHCLHLSWAVVESLLHSLKDIVLTHLELSNMSGGAATESENHGAKPPFQTSQSLRPFAQNLSHELRTPMQGVVGMLDVMHATVSESLQDHDDPNIRRLLDSLRANIEVIQDSSRRAVEAADNVVHAYELDMKVPDTSIAREDEEALPAQASENSPTSISYTDDIEKQGVERQKKQKFDEVLSYQSRVRQADQSANPLSPNLVLKIEVIQDDGAGKDGNITLTPGHQQTNIRDSLHFIVHEALYMGGRPEAAFAQDMIGGEVITVSGRSADGSPSSKQIEWTVDEDVPDSIPVDDKTLAKLVSCVLLNAIKFTERGKVNVRALSGRARLLIIKVTDTGTGIPLEFLPFLFKPFSREDNSLTRSKDGLGLGLLVARGIARKIGGDLVCTRSETVGPNHGSDFELRIPLAVGESSSHTSTPHRTPTPDFVPKSEETAILNSILDADNQAHTARNPSSLDTFDVTSTPRSTSASDSRKPSLRRPSIRQSLSFDNCLAKGYPHTFLVVEDNALNRKILVSMLGKLGYQDVHQAFDGSDAVNQMAVDHVAQGRNPIDMILMDLWMPVLDGYSASEKILAMQTPSEGRRNHESDPRGNSRVTIIAVTADVTDAALEKASKAGIAGVLAKPCTLLDLERKIVEHVDGRFGSM